MAEKKTVQAKVPAKDGQPEKSASVDVNFATSINEAKEMFGEEAVLSNAFANWKVTLQSNIRTSLKSGQDQKAIQDKLGQSKMGVAIQKGAVDPVQAFMARFATSTPEEQSKMLGELKARAKR